MRAAAKRGIGVQREEQTLSIPPEPGQAEGESSGER